MIGELVPLLHHAPDDPLQRGVTGHGAAVPGVDEERRLDVVAPENIEDLGRILGVRPVIEGEDDGLAVQVPRLGLEADLRDLAYRLAYLVSVLGSLAGQDGQHGKPCSQDES